MGRYVRRTAEHDHHVDGRRDVRYPAIDRPAKDLVHSGLVHGNGDDLVAGFGQVARNVVGGAIGSDLGPDPQDSDADFGDERFCMIAWGANPFSGILFFGDGAMSMAYIPLLLNDSELAVPGIGGLDQGLDLFAHVSHSTPVFL